jgi:hypothetical protein
MSEPENTAAASAAATSATERNASSTLTVIVNPEDSIGIPIEPMFISLGLKLTSFKPEVGGSSG